MTEHPQTIHNPRDTVPNGDEPHDRRGWFKALTGIVASPPTSFEIIARSSPWFSTLLLILLGTLLLGELAQPYQQQAARAELAQALPGGAEQADLLMAQAEQAGPLVRWIGRAAAGGVLVIRLLIQTLLVWLLVMAFQGQARFVQTLSLTVHLGVIVLVQGWFALLIASLRGLDAIQSAQDAQPTPGLHLLLAGDNAALNVVWASINLFNIWFLALLALGAASVLGLPQRKGLLLAGIYWAATTAFAATAVSAATRFLPV